MESFLTFKHIPPTGYNMLQSGRNAGSVLSDAPVPVTPSMTPQFPMYPPMAPLGQQVFYGQAPPVMMPPQPGYGFQQQLVPGMRPGGAHMPNYFVPVVQQGLRVRAQV
ncbi:polyadenylate-binding protein 2-like [Lolium rigidum]|uniref:polyadenylate-binding protein 2-like n=1 Tax=Lolium rigidum TaxID=89674 RepID=UPI001F5D18B8|nr:polyadenylate-binding protein 2-like [Lolium rigidum]